uniref:Uncharacterized protein n=1 Tax=Engystomops pustulosus TaxID=76066 RepID=A0AAV6YV98_ENGPU|nr:hypothetical protein GDO81_023581 [Engystomops pustulosus]
MLLTVLRSIQDHLLRGPGCLVRTPCQLQRLPAPAQQRPQELQVSPGTTILPLSAMEKFQLLRSSSCAPQRPQLLKVSQRSACLLPLLRCLPPQMTSLLF